MDKQTAFTPSSRVSNKANIIRLLGEKGPLPRQELAAFMDLTPATITNLTGELMKARYIHEVGFNQGEKGRKGPKSINLDVKHDFFWMIGVHITYRQIEIASVHIKGRVEDFQVVAFPDDLPQEAFGELLIQTIQGHIDRYKDEKTYQAIGVGSFGLVNNDGLLLKVKHFPDWYHLDLQRLLADAFQMPVVVNQHIRAITLAERKYNVSGHAPSFLVVYVREGIGSGMFVDGKMIQRGGQLAHMNYEAGGKQCWCGQQGCMEQYVSEGVVFSELQTSDIDDITNRVMEKDAHTTETLYKYGEILGTGIASFLQMIPMDAIILNGRLFFEGSPMVKGIEDKVLASMQYYEEYPEFVKESLIHGQTIGVIGAASMVMESSILEAYLT